MNGLRLIPLGELADHLRYGGAIGAKCAPLCQKHGLQLLKRAGRTVFATEPIY